jgi:hypothetical protein
MDKGVFFWSTLDLIVEYRGYISLGSREWNMRAGVPWEFITPNYV